MNWEAITIEFVEQNCGGSSLYCGRCGEFHDRDAFSSGRNGQQRANPRFCLRGAPVSDSDFIMALSDAARMIYA